MVLSSLLTARNIGIVVLAGLFVSAGYTVYHMYRSILALEVDNYELEMQAGQAKSAHEAVLKQSEDQARRIGLLADSLAKAKTNARTSETTIRKRNLKKELEKDPEAVKPAIRNELNDVFTSLESLPSS